MGRNIFVRDLVNMLADFQQWECLGRSKAVRPGKRMDAPEPLIAQYGLTGWMDPVYKGPDINLRCRPALALHYNGILRKVPKLTRKQGPDTAGTSQGTGIHDGRLK